MKDLSESIVSSTKTGKSAVHRAAAKSINDAIDFAYENAEINKPIDMKGEDDPTSVDPFYLKIDNTYDVAAFSVFALRRIEAYK